MSEPRSRLLTRKDDLYGALRLLQRDHEDGTIDDTAYQTARARYEIEAAAILRQLDAVGSNVGDASSGGPPATVTPTLRHPGHDTQPRRSPFLTAGALLAVAVALGLLLVAALHGRSGTTTITGAQPSPVATVAAPASAQIVRAERVVSQHPRSSSALLGLGQAYLNAGDLASAHRTYQAVMRLAPSQPQAPTLDALVLAYTGQATAGLAELQSVERAHPTYARAWLTDGLISSRRAQGYQRTVTSWRRFLHLVPGGPLAVEVRSSLQRLIRAHRGRQP